VNKVARIIYNLMAGPFDVEAEVAVVRRFWESRGWQVELCATQSPGHAATLARQAAEDGCHLVLAAGGDGTVGQVAQGLAGSETILAVAPIGTANAFAKLLNLIPLAQMSTGPDLEQICRRLLDGKVQAIDLGRAHAPGLPEEGYRFISWAGTGLDGDIIDRMEPRPKWIKQVTGRRLGWLSYVIIGVPAAMRFPGIHAQIKVDNQSVSGTFVLVVIANSRLWGGGLVQLSPDACLDDGRLDIWLFRGRMFRETVEHALRLLTSRHMMSASTIHLRGRRVLIQTAKPAAVQLDGEPAGHAPLYAAIEAQSLRLLAPAGAPEDLFCRPGVPFSGKT